MNRHNLPLAWHAATDMSATGWVMIANSSNCLISPGWLASIAEGDSIINATLLVLIRLHMEIGHSAMQALTTGTSCHKSFVNWIHCLVSRKN